MARSRRNFLKNASGAVTLASVPLNAAEARDRFAQPYEVIRHFDALSGDKAIKVYAPETAGQPGLLVESASSKMLFVASAIKTFVLCEALRQADSPDVVRTLEQREVALDDTVWSLGSPTFNSPNLTGIVSERTTLEAMITRSDNTATDMAFKVAGASNVRDFIASAGLRSTLVPESTRALVAYIYGAKNYKIITWEQLLKVIEGPIVHPFFNNVQTLASSANDLVSYYSRALQGEFFQHPETLQEFRRILTLCDYIYLIPLPLGVSAYAKSGNADFPNFHARSIAGGMYFSNRWVYFAFIINWYAADQEDPATVEAFFSAINRTLTLVKELLSR